jgi:hypothetical protein
MRRLAAGALILLGLFSPPAPATPDPPPDPLEGQARRFVMLATALGHLRPAEIDAYWGPADLDLRKKASTASLATLRHGLVQLRAEVARDVPSARRDRLAGRLDHLSVLLDVIEKPRSLSFDQQAHRIYGLVARPPDMSGQAQALTKLDRLLPGHGDLASRLSAWRTHFEIPQERRKAVFLRALAECRTRALARWPLPPDEKLDVTWSTDVAAAWHRYQGHHHSLLQINPAAVADPGSALGVACHEGYPGHHAQFVAIDAKAGPRGLPVEDTVVILRSSDQVLREGAANYGVDLAFPDSVRLAFTRDVLFPLAGFDRRQAASFLQIHRAVGELALSVLPILRDYYDGRIASGDAMARLVLDAQVSSPEALLEFTHDMGAYVAGYTVARDMVAACVNSRSLSGTDRRQALREIVTGREIAILDASEHSCATLHALRARND